MFEDEYIKDDTPSALIIMVLSNNVKSRDLHMSNFAWCSQILALDISWDPCTNLR